MNPNCKRIDDYLADTLTPTEKNDFVTHLPGCMACQNEIEIEQDLDQSIQQAWENVDAPESLRKSLATDFVSQPRQRWNSNVVIACFAIASTILVVVSVASWSFMNQDPEVSDTATLRETQTASNQDPIDPPILKPAVTVIPMDGSPSILASQPQSNSEFTILRAYTAVSTKPVSNNQ